MKAGCLYLSYNLLHRNLKSSYHLYSGENGEHSEQRSIFCGIYRCWLEKVVMNLSNHTIYCFCKGLVGVDLEFWTFARGRVSKSIKWKKGGREGTNVGHFMIMPPVEKNNNFTFKPRFIWITSFCSVFLTNALLSHSQCSDYCWGETHSSSVNDCVLLL